ncbi:MAG: hypothetical protein LLG16_07555 [Euryarchaeota archaeon]|nr:hypothetical protein [Euryarchaeota archaeon]
MKTDVRKVLGAIVGIAIVIEGVFLMSVAAPVMIDNIGGVREMYVMLAGVQLALLGALMTLSWFLLDLPFFRSKTTVRKVLYIVVLAINIAVMAEGLFLTTSAEGIVFEGGRSFGRVAAALLCAQLFSVGAISSVLWVVRDKKIANILVFIAGIGSAIGLAAIGATIIGVASPLTTDMLTNVGEGKMTVAGSVLIALSVVLALGFVLDGTKFLKNKRLKMVVEIMFIAITGIIAIGSAYLSALSAHFELGEFFAAGQMYMAAFFAVIFMLSVLVLASWWMRDRKLTLRFFIEALGILAMTLLAGVGIIVFGLAGRTEFEGLFTLPHEIVLLIGAQLVILPCLAIMLSLIRGKSHFDTPTMTSFIDIGMLMIAVLITFEGIATMIASTPLHIENGYDFLESTMSLLGTGIAASGIVMLASWNQREDRSNPRQRRVEVLFAVYLALMFMAALLI